MRHNRHSNIDQPNDGRQLFNVVDFMLLHNLTQVVFSD
jgi:hypothetical protein